MMPSYTEVTQQIGDQWVTALESAQDVISAYDAGARRMPKVDYARAIPEPVAKFNEAIRERLDEAIGERLPKPSEIVEANFELAQRLMAAQRDITLRLLEVSASRESAEQPKASKSTAKA
jgi:hypothetical protein